MPISLPVSPSSAAPIPTTLVLEMSPTPDLVVGTTLRVRATVKDAMLGSLVAPDNLTARVVQGSSSVVVYTLGVDPQMQTVELGVYDLILPVAIAGRGEVRVVSTGSRACTAVARWQAYAPDF